MNGLTLTLLVVCASWAGMRLSRIVPWSEAARAGLVPQAFGLGLAPFLFGVTAVLSLLLLPGASSLLHCAAVVCGLTLVAMLPRRVRHPGSGVVGKPVVGHDWPVRVWLGILAMLALILVAAAVLVPKNLNDALEYMLVARDLSITRDLLETYPGLNAVSSPSGFFFSWTHPPTFVVLEYFFGMGQRGGPHALLPGLLGPWLTLVTTAVVYAVAGQVHPRIGALAGVIFISTPLYFLGSVGGLIDPLPVLGVTLIATAMACSESNAPATPYVIGGTAGLALWSHSISTLFLPIVTMGCLWIFHRLGTRGAVSRTALVVLSALGIGVYPYVWNVLSVGRLVSDSPAVIELNSLRWEEFYDYSRGISTWASKIQYGPLKALFAPEAYGLTFACALIGLGALAWTSWRQRRTEAAGVPSGIRWSAEALSVQTVMGIWVVAFVLGMAASMLLGTNILIRNERYFLAVLGPSAVLAAGGVLAVGRVVVHRAGRRGNLAVAVLLGCFVAVIALGALLLVLFVVRPLRAGAGGAAGSQRVEVLGADSDGAEAMGESRSNLRVIRWMDRAVPKDARVLSFRPGDFVYTDIRVMTHLDPRLVGVYEASSVAEALDSLAEIGIVWVHISDYTPPTLYNSEIARILGDESLSTLVYSDQGHQVYRLVPSDRHRVADSADSKQPRGVTAFHVMNLGGRKDLFSVVISSTSMESPHIDSRADLPLGLFQRHFATYLATGNGPTLLAAGDTRQLQPVYGPELRLDATISGDAFVKVFAAQFDSAGKLLAAPTESGMEFLTEIVLRNGETRSLGHRFLAKPGSRYVKLLFLHHGNSWIQLGRTFVASYL